ncbi:MAG: hypothetical protein LBS19_07985 [Clostridiales bacterium]|jgi:hypothetical protein|nr:hypothetical protein [Clostridiales bacterium]
MGEREMKVRILSFIVLLTVFFTSAGFMDNAFPDTGGDGLTFSDLEGMVFTLSSGAGAWITEVEFLAGGAFTGRHWDSDMGDTGPEYPEGTRYFCSFSGRFAALEQIGPFEYSMICESLEQEGTAGEEEFADGVRYITADPYGLGSSDKFYLYLPGSAAADLPEGFMQWVEAPQGMSYEDIEELDLYGLYNVSQELGLIGPGGYTEKALREAVSAASGEEILMFEYADFDGNGVLEAFAFTGVEDEDEGTVDGRLWFTDGVNTPEELASGYYWSVDNHFTVDRQRFIVLEFYYTTASVSFVYGVRDGKPYELAGQIFGGNLNFTDNDNITVVLDAYDGSYDKSMGFSTGHTWKAYYLFWNNGFKEYAGISITEEEFLKYEGASAVLDEIKESGFEVTDIICRANGIISINLETEDESSIKYENITLTTDGGAVNVMGRNEGVYYAVINEDIAVYPPVYYENLYNGFAESLEWADGSELEDWGTDITSLEITRFEIMDLDGDSVPELLMDAFTGGETRNGGMSGLYRIDGSEVVQLLEGFLTGGSLGGDYIRHCTDTWAAEPMIALTGRAGGFGGTASWSEFYAFRDGELAKITEIFQMEQQRQNYGEDELTDPGLYYTDENGSPEDTDYITIYEVDGERVAAEDYAIVNDRYVITEE